MSEKIVSIGRGSAAAQTASPASAVASAVGRSTQDAAETEYTEVLLSVFRAHLIGTRASSPRTTELAMGILRQFLRHAEAPPWRWTTLHLDAFLTEQAVNKGVGIQRQSAYITYLRMFQSYIRESLPLCNEIHRRFGVQPQTFLTPDNAIPIKRKGKKRKSIQHAMTGVQVNALVSAFDAAIDLADSSHSKSARTLRRDKAMTQVALLTGVRIEELLKIRLSDFQADPKHPQFGKYSLLSVIGKGSKLRVVRLYNPLIVDVMAWYLNEVRPGFLTVHTTDPELLFLSERGGPVDDEQFRRVLARIGLQASIPFKVKPHGLRHTYATHMATVIGPRALQEQLGHEHLSTTLSNYYHPDPHKVGNEINLGINKMAALYDALVEGMDDENFPL